MVCVHAAAVRPAPRIVLYDVTQEEDRERKHSLCLCERRNTSSVHFHTETEQPSKVHFLVLTTCRVRRTIICVEQTETEHILYIHVCTHSI